MRGLQDHAETRALAFARRHFDAALHGMRELAGLEGTDAEPAFLRRDEGLEQFVADEGGIPWISTSCNLQKLAICLKVKVVFSTSQTAVAIGIKGAFDI